MATFSWLVRQGEEAERSRKEQYVPVALQEEKNRVFQQGFEFGGNVGSLAFRQNAGVHVQGDGQDEFGHGTPRFNARFGVVPPMLMMLWGISGSTARWAATFTPLSQRRMLDATLPAGNGPAAGAARRSMAML